MFFPALLASVLAFADPRADLLNLMGGEWVAQGIYVAAKLDIAYHLKTPQAIDALAAKLKVDEKALYRILNMLSSQGVFEQKEGKIFANTPISERLSHDHPETLGSLAVFYGEEIRNAFGSLLTSVETGKPSFNQVYEEPVFDYFKHHPDRAALFQSAMAEKAKAVIQSVVSELDFNGTVCDIGAGKGHLLMAVLKGQPELKGILFDLPEVVASFVPTLPSLKLEGGSFFDAVPRADTYLMKSVLHDWPDEKAVEILRICHASMSDSSVLYVIEPVLMPEQTPDYAKLMDVLMLAVTGGRERTLDEYKTLFEGAGFVLGNIYSTPTEFRILEIRKVIPKQSL